MEIAVLTARIHPAGAGHRVFDLARKWRFDEKGGGACASGAKLASRPIFTMRAVLPDLRVGAYPCFWFFEI
jgi:hypothetical protein